MSIFVTGDLHGGNEIWKLGEFARGDGKQLLENDYVIICGDFGLAQGALEPRLDEIGGVALAEPHTYWLRWLNSRPWTTLFVDGNHERFDLLRELPEEPWKGGMVHRVADRVLHLCRGHVFDLDGTTVFAMGGATSHDKDARTEGIDWWPEELPSYAEMDRAEESLDACGWEVDYVITHAQPQEVAARAMLPRQPCLEDRLTSWLAWIDERLDYRHWYSGHLHVDKEIGKRHTVVFQEMHMLDR